MRYVGLKRIKFFIDAIKTAPSNDILMNLLRELRYLIKLHYY
jgi:hypothetical protein